MSQPSELPSQTAGRPDAAKTEDKSDDWTSWADEDANRTFKTLTHQEAQVLMARNPSVSPWRVIAAQIAMGGVMALLAWLITHAQGVVWSVLYGAATVVIPGALIARGMTSRLSSLTPGVSAVSFMLWEFGKIIVSVLMLALAPKLVPGLSWLALLIALVVCIKVYWVALRWRGRSKV